jgi:hypothetical protein
LRRKIKSNGRHLLKRIEVKELGKELVRSRLDSTKCVGDSRIGSHAKICWTWALALSGGDMMTYYMEGLNWLLYNFHQKKNLVLANEMGKTIETAY